MKMKRLLPIILVALLLVPMAGWSAIYYLSPSGSATPPYDTWEKAANNLNQILSLDLTGENTIYVAEGIYSGSANYIGLTQAKFANLSIIGKGSASQIIFDPGSYSSCYIANANIHDVSLENITIVKNGGGYCVNINNGTNVNFRNCNLVGGDEITGTLLKVANQSNAVISHCRFWINSYENKTSLNGISIVNDASVDIDYSVFYSPNGSFYNCIISSSSGSISVTNCIFAKTRNVIIQNGGSGEISIQNCIMLGSGWPNTHLPTIYKSGSAGDVMVKNTIVLPSMMCPDKYFSDGVITENVAETDPGFKPFGVQAFIIPRVDDTSNVDYAIALANVLSEYEYKGTYFPTAIEADTIVDELRTLVQGGTMEVGVHTYSHQDLTYNHALHFEYTGSDTNPTVELDSSRVIHLRTDGSDNVDIDTTQPNSDTLGEIISNFNGASNWTITYSTTDGQQTDHFRGGCKAESLLEMPPTSAPCDIDFWKVTNCEGGCPGFYGSEIYKPRIDLTNLINDGGNITDPQTGQAYETRTFVAPYNAGDENVLEALRSSGYLGSAGIANFIDYALPYNVYKISFIDVNKLVVEGDEEQTTKNAELFAINAAISGLVVTIMSHTESEATMEEWRWILNGFKRAQKHYNIQVTSLQLAIEALKRLGTYDPSTGDVDIHWSMPSFRLRHDSPCIDAGVKLPIHDENWRDLAGNRIRYGTAPDIGCYEYKTWPLGAWGMLPWIGGRYKVQWTPYE